MATVSNQVLPIAPQLSDDPLVQYSLKMLRAKPPVSPLDDVLFEIETIAADEKIPIIGPVEGAVIQATVRALSLRTGNVLDIGTAVGYSAIWLARALPQSTIISIEIDPVRAERARDFIVRAGLADRVTILLGDVFEILPTLSLSFDVILQDVIKHAYFGSDATLALRLLDLCLSHLVDGGMLLGDNAYCLGEVLLDPADNLPKQVVGIQAYNSAIATHPNLDSVIIPIRDGLWVSHYTR
jgi:predicted O-methyltransferase YrrM